MTQEKIILYKKAYVELYEMIKLLSKEEQEKIPEHFVNYIYENRDTSYFFVVDNSKGLLEQEYMVETKALIVKLYEKYIAPEEEKEFWNNYDRICFNMIEDKKREMYNTDNIFVNHKIIKENENSNNNTETAIVNYKETILGKVINKIKKILFRK